MTIDEIIDYVREENSSAVAFHSPDFYNAIIGYTMNSNHMPVLVYDFDKMIESLSKEYTDSEDPMCDALEWIEYNTLRTLPYIDEDGRPIIIYT